MMSSTQVATALGKLALGHLLRMCERQVVRTDGRRVQAVAREILQHLSALTPTASAGADRILPT